MNVALVGDSTLDNADYTDGGPVVSEQLQAELGGSHSVSMVAFDDDTTRDVSRQLRSLPPNTTHVVLSVGGNDALAHLDLLSRPVTTVADAMVEWSRALSGFERDYRACLREVLALGCPTLVCTVYTGAFEPHQQPVIECTARLFDDVIIQAASDGGCTVLDLRRICAERSDFTETFEPNVQGGGKIGRALAEILLGGTPPGIFPVRGDKI